MGSMEVTFLGTGSAIPSGRVQSGILVRKDRHPPLLMDCGSGVLHNLHRSPLEFDDVGHVLLTHNHLDHMNDIMPLIKADWLVGKEELVLYGPPGTLDTVDQLFDAFDYMKDRIELEVNEINPGNSFNVGGWSVDTLHTKHSVESMAFRLEGNFVYSGDTEPFEAMADFADGCSVLVHDCSFPDDIDVGNHTRPQGLAGILEGCSVDRVYLTHLYPHVNGNEERMLETVREGFDGVVEFAGDMKRVSVDD